MMAIDASSVEVAVQRGKTALSAAERHDGRQLLDGGCLHCHGDNFTSGKTRCGLLRKYPGLTRPRWAQTLPFCCHGIKLPAGRNKNMTGWHLYTSTKVLTVPSSQSDAQVACALVSTHTRLLKILQV